MKRQVYHGGSRKEGGNIVRRSHSAELWGNVAEETLTIL